MATGDSMESYSNNINYCFQAKGDASHVTSKLEFGGFGEFRVLFLRGRQSRRVKMEVKGLRRGDIKAAKEAMEQ
ncbi:hypothetical protein Tco_0487282, partial [Tanacetum coccineum]